MFDFLKRKSTNREDVITPMAKSTTVSKSEAKRIVVQKETVAKSKIEVAFSNSLNSSEKKVFKAEPLRAVSTFRKFVENLSNEELAKLIVL